MDKYAGLCEELARIQKIPASHCICYSPIEYLQLNSQKLNEAYQALINTFTLFIGEIG
jgi:hypothetical protein